MAEPGLVTRAVVVPLDVSQSEERLLISYCGARRFAFNWVVGLVNLDVRRRERAAGVPVAESFAVNSPTKPSTEATSW